MSLPSIIRVPSPSPIDTHFKRQPVRLYSSTDPCQRAAGQKHRVSDVPARTGNGFRVKQQSFGDQNSLRTCPLISILIYIAACSHTGKPDERFLRVFHRHHRKFRPLLFISAMIEKLHDAVFCFCLRRVYNARLPRPTSSQL